MTAVVFYFQVHQPNRLNRLRSEDVGRGREYFDDELNRCIVERVAERSYIAMNEVLGEAIADTGGRFRCSFAITGTLLTQLERWAPRALDSFVALSRTGAVEIVCETGYHSLASMGDRGTSTTSSQRRARCSKGRPADRLTTWTTFKNPHNLVETIAENASQRNRLSQLP